MPYHLQLEHQNFFNCFRAAYDEQLGIIASTTNLSLCVGSTISCCSIKLNYNHLNTNLITVFVFFDANCAVCANHYSLLPVPFTHNNNASPSPFECFPSYLFLPVHVHTGIFKVSYMVRKAKNWGRPADLLTDQTV
jgi:hypothetical protein